MTHRLALFVAGFLITLCTGADKAGFAAFLFGGMGSDVAADAFRAMLATSSGAGRVALAPTGRAFFIRLATFDAFAVAAVQTVSTFVVGPTTAHAIATAAAKLLGTAIRVGSTLGADARARAAHEGAQVARHRADVDEVAGADLNHRLVALRIGESAGQQHGHVGADGQLGAAHGRRHRRDDADDLSEIGPLEHASRPQVVDPVSLLAELAQHFAAEHDIRLREVLAKSPLLARASIDGRRRGEAHNCK